MRRYLYDQTADSQVMPYTSWADLGQHLKHPETLVNLVAAYGHHPSITSQTTVAGRRSAAQLLVDPPQGTDPATVPSDAADFLFGSGAWADAGGLTTTGVDDVDLWVGGLAEVTNLNGGLLGSTFNVIFQTQMERFQDGDRLYYLARTPGMNLRAQLESNSFAELVQRNTEGTTALKADAFATADCRFQLATWPAPPRATPRRGPRWPTTRPASANESLLLVRSPNGTISYRQRNTVDPTGINGQSVYQGTTGADRVAGGNDNDTVWGAEGDDVLEGSGGDDVVLGGRQRPDHRPGRRRRAQGRTRNDAIDAGPGWTSRWAGTATT